jgi:hypothetical protein
MIEYKTTDILLASVLRLEGYVLQEIKIQGFGKGEFHFNDVDQKVINAYDMDQLRIEPKALNGQIRSLTTAVRRMAENRG